MASNALCNNNNNNIARYYSIALYLHVHSKTIPLVFADWTEKNVWKIELQQSTSKI